jgi:hypothetical protein
MFHGQTRSYLSCVARTSIFPPPFCSWYFKHCTVSKGVQWMTTIFWVNVTLHKVQYILVPKWNYPLISFIKMYNCTFLKTVCILQGFVRRFTGETLSTHTKYFDVQGSVHHGNIYLYILPRYYIQLQVRRDAHGFFMYSLLHYTCSACFGGYLHPSAGAQTAE